MNLPPAYVPKLKPEPIMKNISFINYLKVRNFFKLHFNINFSNFLTFILI